MCHSKNIFYSSNLDTPIGEISILADDYGICHILFTDDNFDDTLSEKTIINSSENHYITIAKEQISDYFLGKLTSFNLKLHLQYTSFQLKVYDELIKIKPGNTLTYTELAIALGHKDKIRAVAAANARNKCLIVIPCHRIIGQNNKLVGYRGGLERKRWLLNFEKERFKTSTDFFLF